MSHIQKVKLEEGKTVIRIAVPQGAYVDGTGTQGHGKGAKVRFLRDCVQIDFVNADKTQKRTFDKSKKPLE